MEGEVSVPAVWKEEGKRVSKSRWSAAYCIDRIWIQLSRKRMQTWLRLEALCVRSRTCVWVTVCANVCESVYQCVIVRVCANVCEGVTVCNGVCVCVTVCVPMCLRV